MTLEDDIEELQSDVEELQANTGSCGEKTADEVFEMMDIEIRHIWAAISSIVAAIDEMSEETGVEVSANVGIPYTG